MRLLHQLKRPHRGRDHPEHTTATGTLTAAPSNGAILTQIKQNKAAIARYHLAFENGTMDDTTAGDRLKVLRGEIAQLTARADKLSDTMGNEPAPPPPGTIERLQTFLADTLASGTPAEHKAAIEALVAEIRITDEGVIPVFRIPGPRTSIPGHDSIAATVITEPVRATVRPVSVSGAGGPRTHDRRIMSPASRQPSLARLICANSHRRDHGAVQFGTYLT